jgi:hypothetical protein
MKLIKSLIVLVSILKVLFARRQFIRPQCHDIFLHNDCEIQPHCRWNYTFDHCEAVRRAVLVRRRPVLVRPYARYGGVISRPTVAVSRPTMSVSRPTMSVSRPTMSVSRPTMTLSRPRRIRRF